MDRLAIVDYQSPATRARGTCYRQLCLDVLTVISATLLTIPLDGPVPWRAIGLAAATLLTKTVAATALKYNNALQDDAEVLNFNTEGA